MKLEYQVCALEFSKRLEELGVKQDSLFYWVERITGHGCETTLDIEYINSNNSCMAICSKLSAFTVTELGEMLPVFSRAYNQLSIKKSNVGGWSVKYDCSRESHYSTSNDNLANAMAKMLIHLLENGLMKNE